VHGKRPCALGSIAGHTAGQQIGGAIVEWARVGNVV
jgi:hypothetical protein